MQGVAPMTGGMLHSPPFLEETGGLEFNNDNYLKSCVKIS